MSERSRVVAVTGLLVASLALSATAQRKDFLLFKDPAGLFSIEFPKDWRWMRVAPSGEPLVVFVHPKNEAAVVMERLQMLAPQEVTESFGQFEADFVKEHQPGAENIVATLNTAEERPIVVLDYTRPGLSERERVRQYSFAMGENLYRVTCMALENQFNKYEKTFNDVARSLKAITKEPGGSR